MERWPAQLRMEVRRSGEKRTIVGYAAVFGQLSENLGGFRERIAPGAFRKSLSGDVRALWNHDTGKVLGRTTAGTLRLREDQHGLHVEIDPPESATAYVEALERGDVDNMSFGFYVEKDNWEQEGGQTIRTLQQVKLIEVSAVAFPAYPGTAVSVRGLYGELPDIPESIRRAPVENTQAVQRALAAKATDYARGGQNMATDKTAPMEMRRQAVAHLERAKSLDAAATAEQRLMTEEERSEYDLAVREHARLQEQAQRAEELQTEVARATVSQRDTRSDDIAAPNLNLIYGRGDSEAKAFLAYVRRGDSGGLMQLRASNATDMNIGTSADGGYAVPTGLYQGIIAKRDAEMLARKLGVRNIPGKGTTVNVPIDNGTANVFVSTSEASSFDLDAPALGQAAMTLVKYTKKVKISDELLEDEDARVMDFLTDYIGRALALTHNALLVTEAIAGGTTNALGAQSFAAGHVTTLVYSLKGEYADNAAWLMKRATQGTIQATAGSAFQFVNTPQGSVQSLWGFPLHNSESVAAYGSTTKPLIFGNFNYMGLREAPGLTFLRDPYSLSDTGQILLRFYFRAVYKTLIAEAIRYGTCS